MGQRLPVFVREPADYEPEGDHILCRWGEEEWIMSPSVAQQNANRLNRALSEWHSQKDVVVSMSEHQAASS
jgi:hypothetical protein